MNHNSRTVLYIDLEKQSSEVKNHADLGEFLGGYGVALKLLEQNLESDPVIFSIGPFTAAFPYASKTCTAAVQNEIKSAYVGGGFGASLRLAGLDAVAIKGKAASPIYLSIADRDVGFNDLKHSESPWRDESLLGQVSFLEAGEGPLVDGYFKFSGEWPGESLHDKNLKAIVISGTKSFPFENPEGYQRILKELLSRVSEVEAAASDKKSCFACPLGCERSSEGDVYPAAALSKFLVSCQFAAKIYEDIPTVFACLNSLGYSWTHESLEKLPEKTLELEKEVSQKIQSVKVKNQNVM